MNLPELIDNGRDIRLRPVADRESAIIQYRVILVGMLRELQVEMRRTVIPAYQSDLQFQRDSEAWFQSLRNLARTAIDRAVEQFRALFQRESNTHARRLREAVRRGTGVTLPPPVFTNNSREARLAQDYIERNASLIKSVSDDTVKRIEQAVYDAKLEGTPVRELSRRLRKDLDIVKSRADLIAVDQIASLNADLNRTRLEEIGVEEYIWQHRGDSRVRDLHLRLQGNQYRWGESTGAENGLPPGKPVRCRCSAIPVIPARRNRGRGAAAVGFGLGLLASAVAQSQEDEP